MKRVIKLSIYLVIFLSTYPVVAQVSQSGSGVPSTGGSYSGGSSSGTSRNYELERDKRQMELNRKYWEQQREQMKNTATQMGVTPNK